MYISMGADKKTLDGFSKLDYTHYIYFRGYVVWNQQILFGNEFLPVVTENFKTGRIDHFIKDYNGAFNIIIVSDNHIKIYNNRWGTFPIYYHYRDDIVSVSNDWKKLLPHLINKKINTESAIEMHTFGYVMGKKTLVEGIYECPPHSILEFRFSNGKYSLQEEDYWVFHYPFTKIKHTSRLEQEFAELWRQRIRIYSDFLKTRNYNAYIPISGGLDSRLLLYYFDKAGIPTRTMTYGASLLSNEIKTAQQVLHHMRNTLETRILFYNKSYLSELSNQNFENYDQISCGHIDKRLLSMCDQTEYCYYIPGHDANYMAGENIKHQMLKWKSKHDIIKYIFKFKSSPLTTQLIANNKSYRDILYNSLQQHIPDDDLISSYNRWNGEQRQRRYILRSSIMPLSDNQRILIPYFDYELMDFFINLPLDSLLNQKLYQNTQIRYLYQENRKLIKIKRGGTKTVRIIKNNYFTEYYPKLINEIKRILKIPKPPKLIWEPSIDWQKDIMPMLKLPGYLDLRGLDSSQFINIQYLMTISEVVTALDVSVSDA